MTHGVHPPVKEMKTPDAAAVLDRARAEPERHELGSGHDAVLPRGQFGQPARCGHLGLTIRLTDHTRRTIAPKHG